MAQKKTSPFALQAVYHTLSISQYPLTQNIHTLPLLKIYRAISYPCGLMSVVLEPTRKILGGSDYGPKGCLFSFYLSGILGISGIAWGWPLAYITNYEKNNVSVINTASICLLAPQYPWDQLPTCGGKFFRYTRLCDKHWR